MFHYFRKILLLPTYTLHCHVTTMHQTSKATFRKHHGGGRSTRSELLKGRSHFLAAVFLASSSGPRTEQAPQHHLANSTVSMIKIQRSVNSAFHAINRGRLTYTGSYFADKIPNYLETTLHVKYLLAVNL